MPSNLRHETTFASYHTACSYPYTTSPPPATKKERKMTITQTYRLVHTARSKLSFEASRSEHDLRLLVGHANLLDSLMIEIQQAEEDQEQWFNNNVMVADDQPRHIVWQDELEMPAEEDSESDSDDEEMVQPTELVKMVPPRRAKSPVLMATVEEMMENDEDEEEEGISEDEDLYNTDLSLTRTLSHHEHDTVPSSPPDLVHDEEDSDDDLSSPSESRPDSPQQTSISLSYQTGLSLKPNLQDANEALYGADFFIPEHSPSNLIAAY